MPGDAENSFTLQYVHCLSKESLNISGYCAIVPSSTHTPNPISTDICECIFR